MFFSVVLNNYNYSSFLADSIQSVLDQTFVDFEFIIVDDGSTDRSQEVIKSFNDQRIKTLFKQNGGQGSALQAGIDQACGDYIAFIDSDDTWVKHKLDDVAEILASISDISLLQNTYSQITVEGLPVIGHVIPRMHSGIYNPHPDYRQLKHELPFLPTSCIVGLASACKKLYLHPEDWRIDADTPLLAGLSVMGSIYFLDEPLTLCRVHSSNATLNQSWWTIIYRIKRFYDSLNEHLQSQGSSEKYCFDASKVYLDALICRSKWYSPAGLKLRLARKFRRLTSLIN